LSERENHEAKSLRMHVAMCGMRYTDLSRRLSRVEYLLYGLIALVALGEGPLAEFVRQLAFRP
jgi:hypothetical protein